MYLCLTRKRLYSHIIPTGWGRRKRRSLHLWTERACMPVQDGGKGISPWKVTAPQQTSRMSYPMEWRVWCTDHRTRHVATCVGRWHYEWWDIRAYVAAPYEILQEVNAIYNCKLVFNNEWIHGIIYVALPKDKVISGCRFHELIL